MSRKLVNFHLYKGGDTMLPKISKVSIIGSYILQVTFDDNKSVKYNVKEDFDSIPAYKDKIFSEELFKQFIVDKSRTVIIWNDICSFVNKIKR